MFDNPFSPIFGGKPTMFFGRDDILKRFNFAMSNQGSEDRAFFFTGTRGSGKTALLEQLSIHAEAKHRLVIDLGPEDTIAQLIRQLAGFDETTTTVSPQASVSVLGFGGGLSAGSVSKTLRAGRENLQPLLLEACKRARGGILVTVDEIQKVPIDDVSSLCNAFQMASRKGHDIMLAVAGLPHSHKEIIGHSGCTYLRRAAHEELGLFSWETTEKALVEAFHQVKGLEVNKETIDVLNQASYGQPYLLQLLGYHLVACVNENEPEKRHSVTDDETATAIEFAVFAYERRALKPLVDELPATERHYLRAMSEMLDDDRLASTAQIARKLGSEQKNLSQARARLIDKGIIAAPEHGQVMFCIPYLASYLLKDAEETSVIAEARRRRV